MDGVFHDSKSVKMPALTKTCPKCNENIHVRKSVCDCGHYFVLKRKAFSKTTRKSVRIAMRQKRTVETTDEKVYRQEQNRTNMARMRAVEHTILK